MANVSSISGFKVVGHLNGNNRGKTNLYYVASAADEILVGDIVKLGGTTDGSVPGVPTVDLCGASDVPVGVVVGIINSKIDQNGKMTNGSISLDLPAVAQIAASGSGFVLVNDDPDVLLEVEASNGTPTANDMGLNASHANDTRTAATTTSPAYIDFGTEATTARLNFQIIGPVRRTGNEMGASVKLLVRFNRHQYKSMYDADTGGTSGSTGALGI